MRGHKLIFSEAEEQLIQKVLHLANPAGENPIVFSLLNPDEHQYKEEGK